MRRRGVLDAHPDGGSGFAELDVKNRSNESSVVGSGKAVATRCGHVASDAFDTSGSSRACIKLSHKILHGLFGVVQKLPLGIQYGKVKLMAARTHVGGTEVWVVFCIVWGVGGLHSRKKGISLEMTGDAIHPVVHGVGSL